MSVAALEARLKVEQRLLAALYLWPRVVDLEPHHFTAPAHAALYSALHELQGRQFTPGGFSHVLRALASDGRYFTSVGGALAFVSEVLPLETVSGEEIYSLVERVRACPRCGR